VHAEDRDKLNAAIVAHCEWLASNGVNLSTSPERLGTVDLLQLLPGRRAWCFPRGGYVRLLHAKYRLNRKRRKKSPWKSSLRLRRPIPEPPKPPRTVVDTVVTSLHALCALRTRDRLREVRREAREQAAERVKAAAPDHRAQARRSAKLIDLTHDDAHLASLDPQLLRLQQRLQTAAKGLAEYIQEQRERQRAFVAAGSGGISGAVDELVLARWVMIRCEVLRADVGFFRDEMQGNAAAELTGHAGAADGKAWFRQRSKTKLWLKDVGAPSSLGLALFPDSFGQPDEPDAKRQQNDRERQEVKRAKKRSDSGA